MQHRLALAFNSNRLLGIGGLVALPLVAGSILPLSLLEDGHSLCIFSEITGIPCPFCGATRAFIAFGHADGGWLKYNAYWVLLSLVIIAMVVSIAAAKRLSPRRAQMIVAQLERTTRTSWFATAVIALVVMPGWIWALANRHHIT